MDRGDDPVHGTDHEKRNAVGGEYGQRQSRHVGNRTVRVSNRLLRIAHLHDSLTVHLTHAHDAHSGEGAADRRPIGLQGSRIIRHGSG
jgi:hypothetical protein